MPWVCLQFVIVVFPDNTHLLFVMIKYSLKCTGIYEIKKDDIFHKKNISWLQCDSLIASWVTLGLLKVRCVVRPGLNTTVLKAYQQTTLACT